LTYSLLSYPDEHHPSSFLLKLPKIERIILNLYPNTETPTRSGPPGVVLHQPLKRRIFVIFGQKRENMNGIPVYLFRKTENAPTQRPRKANFRPLPGASLYRSSTLPRPVFLFLKLTKIVSPAYPTSPNPVLKDNSILSPVKECLLQDKYSTFNSTDNDILHWSFVD